MKTTPCTAGCSIACGLLLTACAIPSDGGAPRNDPPAGPVLASGGALGTGSSGRQLPPHGAAAPVGTAAGGSGSDGPPNAGAPGSAGGPLNIVIALDQPEQEMTGFGVSDLFAPPLTNEQAELLFSPSAGIGLSILRIGMSSSGDPLTTVLGSSVWSSDPLHDITLAQANGASMIIATVLSAPAAWKSNGSEIDGGHLNADSYDEWATRIADFPSLLKTKGVDLYALSIANEPDFASCSGGAPCYGSYPSMLYTADELLTLMRAVAPKLHEASPTVALIAPEPSEWSHLWSNQSAVGSSNPLSGVGYDYGHALFQDSEAWDPIDIIGTQQYDTQVAMRWPNDMPRTKPVWQTQMAGVEWWPEGGAARTSTMASPSPVGSTTRSSTGLFQRGFGFATSRWRWPTTKAWCSMTAP